MNALTSQNIESELSYAYLHAVTSHAGASCTYSNRHEDNAGIDANITAWAPFPDGGYRTEVDLKVQLKATVAEPKGPSDYISYSLKGIKQYNDLRSETFSTPRLLVVLFLPESEAEWLIHTEEDLRLQRCAYWVSLRGAEESENATSQTVYIPRKQRFDVLGLKGIFSSISKNEKILYDGGPE
ncbi:DUF4365 domain-containing protein [Tranquillimonas rosea]|uniref:DUF4365 domain-containing protein n=1 Tax=Tranquillimonas rosea TaxID=641238 RepID=UPI003BAC4ED6